MGVMDKIVANLLQPHSLLCRNATVNPLNRFALRIRACLSDFGCYCLYYAILVEKSRNSSSFQSDDVANLFAWIQNFGC